MSDFENTGVMEIPVQRRINYAGLVVAIVAVIMAIIGIVLANSADTHAGEVGGKVSKVEKFHSEFVQETVGAVSAIHVRLSADATRLTAIEGDVKQLERKSVVEALAKELREGKASVKSVRDLADQMLDKADVKSVKRLARRMNRFNDRLIKVEGIVLPKDEPKADIKPVEQSPAAKPAVEPQPAKSPVPATTPNGKPETPVKMP